MLWQNYPRTYRMTMLPVLWWWRWGRWKRRWGSRWSRRSGWLGPWWKGGASPRWRASTSWRGRESWDGIWRPEVTHSCHRGRAGWAKKGRTQLLGVLFLGTIFFFFWTSSSPVALCLVVAGCHVGDRLAPSLGSGVGGGGGGGGREATEGGPAPSNSWPECAAPHKPPC